MQLLQKVGKSALKTYIHYNYLVSIFFFLLQFVYECVVDSNDFPGRKIGFMIECANMTVTENYSLKDLNYAFLALGFVSYVVKSVSHFFYRLMEMETKQSNSGMVEKTEELFSWKHLEEVCQ